MSEAKQLFNQWSGNSYCWESLSNIEQQRWVILSEIIHSRITELEKDRERLDWSIKYGMKIQIRLALWADVESRDVIDSAINAEKKV